QGRSLVVGGLECSVLQSFDCQEDEQPVFCYHS
ncbi:hypothetical protein MRX96_046137, partial [Rhipicephalus microplus]